MLLWLVPIVLLCGVNEMDNELGFEEAAYNAIQESDNFRQYCLKLVRFDYLLPNFSEEEVACRMSDLWDHYWADYAEYC